MDTTSVWRATAGAAPGYAMLQADATTDVLVVGGGITGVTLALLLARAGRSVMLLEAGEIGCGTTGNSTGNLYVTVSEGLDAIAKRFDTDVARQVVQERRAAIDFVAAHAGTDSGFRRCPMVLSAFTDSMRDSIASEQKALAAAGVDLRLASTVPAPLPAARGNVLMIENQAQFQPQLYVTQLAKQAVEAGAKIHEHTAVLDIDFKNNTATTATGAVQAGEIVLATHSPKGVHPVHTEMPVHREYVIARPLTAAADPGPGIFWCQGDDSLSVRTLDEGGERFLICAGDEVKTGDHNAKASLMALQALADKHLGPGEWTHRWSAQNYRGADGLPYIGRDVRGCFIATGFSTDGLTWGTVAARIISAQLMGAEPAFAHLCKASRVSPVKGARSLFEETVTTVKALVKDYLTDRQEEKLSELAVGDSAIVDVEGESFAAWRAPDGELFAVSPVCTHMGCKVHWNSVETSWDCPCHGSRFSPDGAVVEGPALAPLKRKYIALRQA